jgi:5'-nucleotidase (lipoprotein e(P4) family)
MSGPPLLALRPLQALALAAALVGGCATTAPQPHEMLNAVLWQQTSAEYAGLTQQIYRTALRNLEAALADPAWTAALEQTGDYAALPPAIILDLDETVLDNSGYESRIVLEYGHYTPESFADWCREGQPRAIPGARAFLETAIERGVTLVYYSARPEALRQCTERHLRGAGLPLPPGTQLLLSNGHSKSAYRATIAEHYRILLLIGDNLTDFIDDTQAGPFNRSELAMQHADRWGRQWILLPNPMYGHWEASCYDYDYRLGRTQQLIEKLRALSEGQPRP